MKIQRADFLLSATSPAQFPAEGMPEIAFAGRSNVGKSSLINTITSRKKLAITSRTPGRTQMINFFDINGRIRLVDLPGYGYAKAPQAERKKWAQLIDTYLQGRESLAAVVLIIDIRHDASPLDVQMLELLAEAQIPTIPVFTKADKLARNPLARQIARLEKALGIPRGGAVPFSSVTRQGVNDMWGCIADAVEIPIKKLSQPVGG